MGWGTSVIGLADLVEDLGDLQTRLDGSTVYVTGTSVEYAVHQEFGTSKMEAQPFLRPAIEQVMRNPVGSAQHYVSGEIGSEAQLVRGVALAIEDLAKRFAPVDTGNLKGSIEARRVR